MYIPPHWEKLDEGGEYGADKMLKALIAKGSRTHMFRTNSNPISISNPRKRGWYVFIEDVKL